MTDPAVPRDPASRDPAVERMLAEHEIRNVCLRYCRGIDRRQFDIVRDCYHPDAIDEHGDFVGDVDAFIAHAARSLQQFETTQHFVGNILVEVDGDRARCEMYAMAMHRISARQDPRGDRPARDHVVGLRYVDDFERRAGTWRIANRICVFDWTRTDPVPPGWQFADSFRRGRTDGGDAVFAPSLRTLIAGRHPSPPPRRLP